MEALVLRLLIAGGESYGLDLVKKSDGTIKRGSVYVTLGRMEKKKFVSSRQEESTPDYVGIPRRLYKIEGLGEKALKLAEMGEAMFAGKLVHT
jgi:DNA-binding PadR family transcriptional regulator